MAAPCFHPGDLSAAESLRSSRESLTVRGMWTGAFLVDSTSILAPSIHSQPHPDVPGLPDSKSFTSSIAEFSTLHGDQRSAFHDGSTSTLVPSIPSQPNDGVKSQLDISHLNSNAPCPCSGTELPPGWRATTGIHGDAVDCRRPACYGGPQCQLHHVATSAHYEPESHRKEAENTLWRLGDFSSSLSGVTAERKRMRLADQSEKDPGLYLAWCFQHPEDAPSNRSMRGINQPKGKKQAQRNTVRQLVENEFGAVSESTKPGPKVVDEQKRLFPTADTMFSAATTRTADLEQEGPLGEVWVVEAPLPWGCMTWEEAQGRVDNESRGSWTRHSRRAGGRGKGAGVQRQSEGFRHRLGRKCRSLIPSKRLKSTSKGPKGSSTEACLST